MEGDDSGDSAAEGGDTAADQNMVTQRYQKALRSVTQRYPALRSVTERDVALQ